jgi:hypothetical protein
MQYVLSDEGQVRTLALLLLIVEAQGSNLDTESVYPYSAAPGKFWESTLN